ncbi:MAG: phosphoribosylformylglycinamidine synthase subunit PurL, partial [Flavobacteriales bacterium]|nr:phosphoribosylformylglycinamidine synthase subunit PurL [Flavobacteriales bacterium]
VALDLLSSPNIASKRWVSEQYDSMVRTNNMSTNAPSDAGIVLVKETGKGLVMSVDCNGRYVHADPYIGTMVAVCEAARNISCSGGEPCGVTNCLNFGNPYDPEVYWQFTQAIKGMGEACRALETPVTGGNVSFYNHTVSGDRNIPVFPTPTIGMVGVMADISKRMSLDFKTKGDLIFLLGKSVEDIACSEYLVRHHGIERSPAPYFDLEEERRLHTMLLILIRKGVINAAHDISDGGLWTTLVEMGLPRGLGFDVITDSEIRPDAFMFGEAQGRAVVAVNEDEETDFLDLMQASRVPFILLGHVTKGKLMVDDEPFGSIEDARTIYESAIPKAMAEQ